MGSARIGSLRVDLGMNTAQFERGVKRSQKQLDGFAGGMQRLGRVTKVVAAASATAFSAAFTKTAVDINKRVMEAIRITEALGLPFEQFQRDAYAAMRVTGIEMDKFGDIVKDVQDKVGDFIATGGGPMADFFENIAPKVGVTKESFKGLSGREGLQLYYDSLKQANVSQEEMTFYLEAVANDASLLIPILEKGGKTWEEYGEKAATVSKEQAETTRRFNEEMANMEQGWERFVIFTIDGLKKTSDAYYDSAENSRKWVDAQIAGIEEFAGKLKSRATEMAQTIQRVPEVVGKAMTAAGAYVRDFVIKVEEWIVSRLGRVWKNVETKVNQVKGYFFELYDAVVGHSYVPDMVDGIRDEMARLDAVMVNPAKKATESTQEAFAEMQMQVASLLARIFPARDEINGLLEDIALLDKAKGSIDKDTYVSARERLQHDLQKAQHEMLGERFGVSMKAPEALILFDKTPKELEKFGLAVNDNAKRIEAANVRISESFKDAADQTLSAIERMTSAVKGGDFLSILEAVIGLGLQLASIGVFGSKVADRVNKPIPRANGGPVVPGKLYMVGEEGPELATFGQAGRIISNDNAFGGGSSRVEIIPSKYFDVVVDGRAAQVAAPMAQAAAVSGAGMARVDATRRRNRQFP